MSKFKPHEYQKLAINKIINTPNCMIMLDMGLGKTASTLEALYQLRYDYFEIGKVLVIAPLRVANSTWVGEIEKWSFDLKAVLLTGDRKNRTDALKQKADIYIINVENLEWLFKEVKWDFDTVVIDESSKFKNPKSRRFKIARSFRKHTKRIIELTGTPTPNGLLDLWSQIYLLDKGQRLGKSMGAYRDRYFNPDKRNGHIVFSYKLKEGAEKQIYEEVKDLSISMKSVDWLKMHDLITSLSVVDLSKNEMRDRTGAVDGLKMPELITRLSVVELSKNEMSKYEELRKSAVLNVENITALNAAVLAGKLLQLANGVVYNDDQKPINFHERKLEAMLNLIDQANGQPVIVAYWFRHDLVRIKEYLSRRGLGYGELKNDKDIKAWNTGGIEVLLLHPASAGHGLNLQEGGNKIIWYGPIWNLENWMQTNARLYRQGQKAKTVFIWVIVAKDTIDEMVLPRLESKEMNQEELLQALKVEKEVAI